MRQTLTYNQNGRNVQYTGSINYASSKINLQANIYFKNYTHLFDDYRYEFFNRINGINILDQPFNTTSGTSKGIEIMARKNYEKHLLMLSYAIAEIKIFNDIGQSAFRDFDQRHTVIIENIFRLPHHWNISFLWRYHSVHPYTPTAVNFGGRSDFSDREIIFYNVGEENSQMLPNTHTLGFKIEKSWFFKRNKLNGDINIVNLYNIANMRSYWWNIHKNGDYISSAREYQSNIPFFISPGISYTIQ